ncbi:MAG: hypothetical protein DLM63_00925 [Solirubrobacterales bacterium]|nr:MAG: hypothetical protein DLM63_00925 [Solirubrobacterales bacterium]
MAVAFAAPAQAAATHKLTFRAMVASFRKVDEPPVGDSVGDRFEFTDILFVHSRRVGRDAAVCVHTDRVYYICDWTIVLRRGTLQLHLLFHDTNAGYTLAVDGGTGSYARASGTMRVTDALKPVGRYVIIYRILG